MHIKVKLWVGHTLGDKMLQISQSLSEIALFLSFFINSAESLMYPKYKLLYNVWGKIAMFY